MDLGSIFPRQNIRCNRQQSISWRRVLCWDVVGFEGKPDRCWWKPSHHWNWNSTSGTHAVQDDDRQWCGCNVDLPYTFLVYLWINSHIHHRSVVMDRQCRCTDSSPNSSVLSDGCGALKKDAGV